MSPALLCDFLSRNRVQATIGDRAYDFIGSAAMTKSRNDEERDDQEEEGATLRGFVEPQVIQI